MYVVVLFVQPPCNPTTVYVRGLSSHVWPLRGDELAVHSEGGHGGGSEKGDIKFFENVAIVLLEWTY
jgi:hypothetical protein